MILLLPAYVISVSHLNKTTTSLRKTHNYFHDHLLFCGEPFLLKRLVIHHTTYIYGLTCSPVLSAIRLLVNST